MTTTRALAPELREPARRLVATGRIRAETDAESYRAAIRGRRQLTDFFRSELGWELEIVESAELVRLHKRRADVPAGRGPRLRRDGREAHLASKEVLALVALVCEQLWRRPRMSLRELMQAIAQVCAAEEPTGGLPRFKVVATDGTGKADARTSRLNLVDALKLLVAEGSIAVDADLERIAGQDDGDLVVSASRERLAMKFSSLSPALLGLDALEPERHVAALSADVLTDDVTAHDEPTVDDRRLLAMRRLIDDPAADPLDDPAPMPYLHTPTGRERALEVVAALGFSTTARRDWWEVTDPSGVGTLVAFPNGRRNERQAALALLDAVNRRPDPRSALGIAEIVELFEHVRTTLPRWAAAYEHRLPALARAAAAELVAVGLLVPLHHDTWRPTPGVHLWKVRVQQNAAEPTEEPTDR
ncbi:DUF2398 family protein [Saccharothrix obliqua]|uniref:DUF2398 family protein n=1 Tax=Saccharothrix obliqua TaxID=2861747 RepID=UPI001C5F7259|nr:DUF2398 family protein [Saccharothrix obliqua]MBW4721501.1 TIGR02678 family protein [Saccharothrix obliqua]